MVAGTAELRTWARGGPLPAWFAAVLVAMLASGCVPPDMGRPQPSTRAPVPSTAPPAPPPTVAVIRPVPDIETTPPAPAEPLPAPRTAPPVSSASQALLTQSRGHQAAGRYEQAAASIERALRIEPRQPVLWLELGDIRLKEGDFAQAESMGRKALSLATGDAALTARAEQLIATAKRR
ncbi:MAG: tetratricopeptide repeat protein [Chromatiales bacterium]|nr:tetratricopeptide repeat protein [Chromatiales bacterium]